LAISQFDCPITKKNPKKKLDGRKLSKYKLFPKDEKSYLWPKYIAKKVRILGKQYGIKLKIVNMW
jgi:hypothetical protein